MSTIAAPKGSPQSSPCTPTKQLQFTPTAVCWVLVDGGAGTVTQDHKCARLQPGGVYRFNSGAADSRVLVLSDAAQNVDYQESPIPISTGIAG